MTRTMVTHSYKEYEIYQLSAIRRGWAIRKAETIISAWAATVDEPSHAIIVEPLLMKTIIDARRMVDALFFLPGHSVVVFAIDKQEAHAHAVHAFSERIIQPYRS